MTKALFINAHERKVEEIVVNYWTEIAPKIGADLFACVGISEDETIYVDDEGLFAPNQVFFKIQGYPDPLAGNAIIMGIDYTTGDSTDTKLTASEVLANIRFLTRSEVML